MQNQEELLTISERHAVPGLSRLGAPFYKTFKAAGFHFFKVDHNVFAPAKVVMNEIKFRRTFVSGKVNINVSLASP